MNNLRTRRIVLAALAVMVVVACAAWGAEAYVVKTYTSTTSTKTGTTTYRPSVTYVKTSSGTTYYYYKPPTQPAPSPTPTPSPTPQPATGPTQSGLTADENQLVYLANEARAQYGLRPLAVDMRLVDLARKKSADMIANNYFGHISPTYGSPFDMMQAAGIAYKVAGANVAGAATVKDAHAMLMASEDHKANILGSQYTHIGVGVVNGGPYGKMITELFIGN